MKEIKGNLISLAKEGRFDIIGHGCNCFCRMGSGIAPQIKEAFPSAWTADLATNTGDITKLGSYTIGYEIVYKTEYSPQKLIVLNIYTQFTHNASTKPLDYEALTLAFRKINYNYKGKSIALPLIGAGLAGGDWNKIREIIMNELKDMDVIIVHYDGTK